MNVGVCAHTPVLLKEAVAFLNLKRGDTVVDCTVGSGGHAWEILEKISPNGRLVGIDRDPRALLLAEKRLERFKGRYCLIHGDFRRLDDILQSQKIEKVDGVLLDLGVSSFQLEDAQRGFSFQRNGPLDMRMDPSQARSAEQIVNRWSLEDLTKLMREYGEIKNARAVAKKIVRERSRSPIRDTLSLATLAQKASTGRRKKVHPATQVFQAIRIAVNDELGAMREALPKAVACLSLHGRVCVISFHSLEDRIAKEFFKQLAAKCVCPPPLPFCRCGGKPVLKLVVRKPVRPTPAEIAANPRSRSARMRVAEKMNEGSIHSFLPSPDPFLSTLSLRERVG